MKAQRRPDAATLEILKPLLEDLRALHGLQERRSGCFYFAGRELIHFHKLPNDIVADVRFANNFTRMSVASRAQQLDALDRLTHALSALEARPQRGSRKQ